MYQVTINSAKKSKQTVSPHCESSSAKIERRIKPLKLQTKFCSKILMHKFLFKIRVAQLQK